MKVSINIETNTLEWYDGEFRTPNNTYELEVIENIKPDITETEILESEWVIDNNNKTYTLVYNVRNKTQNEIDSEGWDYVDYNLRIKAPMELILEDIGIKIYGWFQINQLPIVNRFDGFIYLYCNVILPQHQAIIDSLSGVIIVENKPE